jgi:hypothetical protein
MSKKNTDKSAAPGPRHTRVNLLIVVSGLIFGGLVFGLFSNEAPDEKVDSNNRRELASGAAVSAPMSQELVASPSPSRTSESVQPSSQFDRPRNILPPPVLHTRPESEWQGMLVDLSLQAICEETDRCGLAMSCRENLCGPCSYDEDCGRGESCVLDHCVRSPNVSCRVSQDCGGDSLCVLSGYSTDARGNEDMSSYCQSGDGGAEPDPDRYDQDLLALVPGPDADPRPVSITELRDVLEEDPEEGLELEETEIREPFDEEAEEREFQQSDPIDYIDPEPDFETLQEVQEMQAMQE